MNKVLEIVLKLVSGASGFFGLINGKWIHLIETDPGYSQWQIYASFVLSAIGIALGWGNSRRTGSPSSRNRSFLSAAIVFVMAVAIWYGYAILVNRWAISPPSGDWGRAALGPTVTILYGLIFGFLSLGFSLVSFGLGMEARSEFSDFPRPSV